jgi:hypothetical protein
MPNSLILSAINGIDEEDYWATVENIKFIQSGMVLSVHLKIRGTHHSKYACTITDVLDYDISDLNGGWSYLNHLRIIASSSSTGELFYQGIKCVSDAIGCVLVKHFEKYDGWIDPSNIINKHLITLGKASSNGGKFASGPVPVLEYYARILNDLGVTTSVIENGPRKYYRSGSLETIDFVPVGLHFGQSYIVARHASEQLV